MLLRCTTTKRNVQNAFAQIHWCTDAIWLEQARRKNDEGWKKRYEWKWTIRREETIGRGGTIDDADRLKVEYLKGAN